MSRLSEVLLCRTVEGWYSSRRSQISPTSGAVVCNFERANMWVNQLLEEGTLRDTICCIVVDELHMVHPACTHPRHACVTAWRSLYACTALCQPAI